MNNTEIPSSQDKYALFTSDQYCDARSCRTYQKSPGTAGSFLAVLCAPLCFLPFSLPIRLLILSVLFLIGIKASEQAEKELKEKDPSSVIIDEVVGQWLTLLPVNALSYFNSQTITPQDWFVLMIGFLFFRIFDIGKIGPVGLCERKLQGGLGIMADDVMAGFLAALLMYPLQFYGNLIFGY